MPEALRGTRDLPRPHQHICYLTNIESVQGCQSTSFAFGERCRLAASGAHVVTVKPGFVRTRMTDGMDLPARLTATPEEVVTAVVAAIHQRCDVIYVRRVWRLIMFVLRAVPERLFKRMSGL